MSGPAESRRRATERRVLLVAILLTLFSEVPATSAARAWRIDPANSAVTFRVRHLVISTVPGRFHEFTGRVVAPTEDFCGAEVEAVIQVASLDTGSRDRDEHLLSESFFDAENHPELSFAGKAECASGSQLLIGNLTMRGVRRPIELALEFGGRATMFGRERAAFEARGRLDRFDYNVSWNQLLETGEVMVGREVEIVLNMELVALD